MPLIVLHVLHALHFKCPSSSSTWFSNAVTCLPCNGSTNWAWDKATNNLTRCKRNVYKEGAFNPCSCSLSCVPSVQSKNLNIFAWGQSWASPTSNFNDFNELYIGYNRPDRIHLKTLSLTPCLDSADHHQTHSRWNAALQGAPPSWDTPQSGWVSKVLQDTHMEHLSLTHLTSFTWDQSTCQFSITDLIRGVCVCIYIYIYSICAVHVCMWIPEDSIQSHRIETCL